MKDCYRVVVTREGHDWLAEMPDLEGGHTFARTLAGLDRAVREVIVLAADLPDDAISTLRLDWEYHTGDATLDDKATAVRRIRAEADQVASAAARQTSEAARTLVSHGLSVRDTAAALGISPQRVSQLTDGRAARAG
jgi:hypothetical protein